MTALARALGRRDDAWSRVLAAYDLAPGPEALGWLVALTAERARIG